MTKTFFSPDAAYKIKHLALHRTHPWILSASLPSNFSDALAIDCHNVVDLKLETLPLSLSFPIFPLPYPSSACAGFAPECYTKTPFNSHPLSMSKLRQMFD
jgi:hypothetical protein